MRSEAIFHATGKIVHICVTPDVSQLEISNEVVKGEGDRTALQCKHAGCASKEILHRIEIRNLGLGEEEDQQNSDGTMHESAHVDKRNTTGREKERNIESAHLVVPRRIQMVSQLLDCRV